MKNNNSLEPNIVNHNEIKVATIGITNPSKNTARKRKIVSSAELLNSALLR